MGKPFCSLNKCLMLWQLACYENRTCYFDVFYHQMCFLKGAVIWFICLLSVFIELVPVVQAEDRGHGYSGCSFSPQADRYMIATEWLTGSRFVQRCAQKDRRLQYVGFGWMSVTSCNSMGRGLFADPFTCAVTDEMNKTFITLVNSFLSVACRYSQWSKLFIQILSLLLCLTMQHIANL